MVVDTGVNWKGVFFWIIAILLLACIIFYFFDLFGFRASVSALTSQIGIPKLDSINLSGVTDFITKNAALLGVGLTLGTTAITYFVKNYQTNKLLDASIKKANEAQLQATQLANSKLSALENELSIYKGDTTADELQKTLSSITGEKDLLTSRIAALQAQNEQLSKMPTQMANELWAKSGGQIITIGDEKFKVIEKAIVNVK